MQSAPLNDNDRLFLEIAERMMKDERLFLEQIGRL
jgi:hypothetical protein